MRFKAYKIIAHRYLDQGKLKMCFFLNQFNSYQYQFTTVLIANFGIPVKLLLYMKHQISPNGLFVSLSRLAYDTKPELVLNLLLREWCLERPKLLITTTGGKANFELQPRIKRSLRRGLLKAAKVPFIYNVF